MNSHSSHDRAEAASLAREAALAPYAMRDSQSRGRRYPEASHPYRAAFQRDRDRITHSAAYRRLSYKTQVFTGEMGDYHRSRLTHTLEVASVARTLGRALQLNEDLTEALALAHDLGHPPFGHAGEDTLDLCLRTAGGFSHNAQGLRIVELLEQRYPSFPGLNLSLELLEGQATRVHKGASPESPLVEAQVVEAADSIAYDTHDADDALHLGLLVFDDLLQIPLWREAAQRVRAVWTGLRPKELERAILHELIDWQVSDLIAGARPRLEGIDSPEAVRGSPPVIVASSELAAMKQELERFLHQRVYRHPQVVAKRTEAQQALQGMFERYVADPALLPESFRGRIEEFGLPRTVGDYLSGMTDRYAMQQAARLLA